jgi:hypothetical protein
MDALPIEQNYFVGASFLTIFTLKLFWSLFALAQQTFFLVP